MIQLFVQHHRLLDYGQIEPLTFLGFEVLKSFLLEQALSEVALPVLFLLLSLPIVSNVQQLLCALPLRIYFTQYALLVSL